MPGAGSMSTASPYASGHGYRLLPDWRGRGIGTALMQWVCTQARAAGKSVTVSVEKYNRAQTLYRRLGFREISDEGVHWAMEWRAAADERAGVS